MTFTEHNRIGDVCAAHLLPTKWLLAPSHRIGHQWVEAVVRGGQPVVNLQPTTALRLALEVVGGDVAEEGLAFASRDVGALVVNAVWSQLTADGYLGRLDQSADLSAAVFDSLMSLRLAGCETGADPAHFENGAKARDIQTLLGAYQSFLNNHELVDEADVLRLAIERLEADAGAIDDDTLVLVPNDLRVAGLERRLIDALPAAARVLVKHPAEQLNDSAPDIRLLANVGRQAEASEPKRDGSVDFFRAVGEVNEVRETLRRCLSDGQPLDDVEILHTDAETYIPLIYAAARRYGASDRPEGLPVTFAEGIPATLSRPGRALIGWLRWIQEGYPQRLLVEMIGEGLLDCGDEDDLSFHYLARLLRPIAIGQGAERYLPKLDEQIKAAGNSPPKASGGDDDAPHAAAMRQRRQKGLRSLRKLIKRLMRFSSHRAPSDRASSAGAPTGGAPDLEAVETFLNTCARSVSELDRYAGEALIERLQDRRLWLERLGLSFELGKWLAALPSQVRVLGSGPRPGHLHVAHLGAGGHSGRRRTFVVGMDDRRFPGASLQDPILLDGERSRLSPELSTSALRMRQKIDDLAAMLSRLAGSVTLGWPCHDLVDDRETFASSYVLSAYRLISGRPDADLQSLNDATAPPASFAPTSAEKSLDAAERWLWRLSGDSTQGADHVACVESFFPHLARGSAARAERSAGFGPFNGCVPQAGKDLDPFADEGPVLSASAMEIAGRCPLAYFFRNGLGLFPPDELEIDPDRWLDPAQFGSLLHDAFRQFMDELSQAGRRPQFERDHRRLAKILHDAVDHWRGLAPPPNENAFRVQYWQLVRTSRIFLQSEEEFCRASQPRFFEVALGLENEAGHSPLDEAAPTKLQLPGGRSIRVRGQIDRVDETDAGRYSVWDYKIASGYGYEPADPFRQGRRVQSVLYLQMIEAALRQRIQPGAVVQRFGYFFPSIRAHGLRVDWDADSLSGGAAILENLCGLMAQGAFVATDDPSDCAYCDYASICGDTRQLASQSKTLLDDEKLVELSHFRELRRG